MDCGRGLNERESHILCAWSECRSWAGDKTRENEKFTDTYQDGRFVMVGENDCMCLVIVYVNYVFVIKLVIFIPLAEIHQILCFCCRGVKFHLSNGLGFVAGKSISGKSGA